MLGFGHEALWRSRFEDSPLAQAVLAPTAEITAVNDALVELLGRPREELLGRRPRTFIHASESGAADGSLDRLFAGESDVAQVERIFAHSSGRPVPALITVSSVSDEAGAVGAFSVFFHDLTILHDSKRRLQQQERFFHVLGQRAHDAAVLCDETGRLLFVSESVRTMFGYDPMELLAQTGRDFIHPDDVPVARAAIREIVASGGTTHTSFRIRHANGEWRQVCETLTNLAHTPIGGVVCNLVDVTERCETEAALHAAEARNRAIVECAQEGIWVLSADGKTEFANAAMADVLGLPLQLLYDRGPLDLVVTTDGDMFPQRLRNRATRGRETYEVGYLHPDGHEHTLRVVATPLAVPDGSFHGGLAVVTDVTEARRIEAELRRAALHDALTGLPNRTLLRDRLEQALLSSGTPGSDRGQVAVGFIDLDYFKLINDSWGHAAGDDLLIEVATRLREAIDPRDTVARLGGDEFVVVARVPCVEEAQELAARLLDVVSDPMKIRDQTVQIKASIGVAMGGPGDDVDGLLRYADIAMYAAKDAGRARVRMFDQCLAAEAEQQFELSTDLRVALRSDELALHYQPIIELSTGRVLGYEGLARWNHPRQGEISPGVFVPIAENTGVAGDLDRWAVRQAISDLAAVQPPFGAGDAFIAINLSARHLGDTELEDYLLEAIGRSGFSPSSVSLEITEGAVMHDITASTAMLRRLRERGFGIALDDFGTGHSSLAYLRTFPITTLKIDRSFIADLTVNTDALAIITSILQLARAIGVAVTAEGVTTHEQASLLSNLGCARAQGWLWSPAMPLSEVAASPRRYPPAAPLTQPVAPQPIGRMSDSVVERLRELQQEGASLVTMAAALNAEGHLTPNGKRWHKMSVARALSTLSF